MRRIKIIPNYAVMFVSTNDITTEIVEEKVRNTKYTKITKYTQALIKFGDGRNLNNEDVIWNGKLLGTLMTWIP